MPLREGKKSPASSPTRGRRKSARREKRMDSDTTGAGSPSKEKDPALKSAGAQVKQRDHPSKKSLQVLKREGKKGVTVAIFTSERKGDIMYG